MNVKFIGSIEIILIVIISFTFAYIVSMGNSLENLSINPQESKTISKFREIVLNYLSKGMVSAQPAMQTCSVNHNGTLCQEYLASVCDSKCASSCFPGVRKDSPDCKLGTCYDSAQGLCNAGTPKSSCESAGGQWSLQQPVQCNRECCLISPDGNGHANQAKLSTQQQSNNIGKTSGAKVSWVPVDGEVECLKKATSQNEGACVLDLDLESNKYNCKFITETDCMTKGGQFYVSQLCTNPELKTKCEKTANTQCFNGKYGVYFIDSCGNKANVYDNNKLNDKNYWSTVVSIKDGCSLGTSSNFLANQQRCGNCDYLAGSICGTPIQGKDNPAISGQYVCRDLSCIDENGKKRKQGESWCAFDGAIGIDGANGTNEERSVDVPGSRHYKKLCFDGEIRLEPCAEYRNGLCVESDTNVTGVTRAFCKVNTASDCITQNEDAEKLAKCEENSDCFLKHVEIQKFKFDVCAPKYPAGFELNNEPKDKSEGDEGESSETICAVASQKCTYYEKKGFGGKWSCEINCKCKDAIFTETMNNLCMSLGDCGGKVNLAGEYSKNYVIKGDKSSDIGQSYINDLKKYATPVKDQRVDLSEGDISNDVRGLDEPSGPKSGFVHRAVELWKGNRFWMKPSVAVTASLFGVGKYRERKVTFECLPWQPPTGGSNCDKCNDNGLGCTKYKCKSLGKACDLLNSEDHNPLCVSMSSSDTIAPEITFNPSALSSGFSYEPLASVSGVQIKSSASDGCLKEVSTVSLGIKLNEPGKCKYSTERVIDYKSMEKSFDGENPNDYSLEHNNTFAMPLLEGGADPARRGEYNLYIRCQDGSPNSNSNDQDYTVNFCVMPADDKTPPTIGKFVPESPGAVGINADSLNIQFYTNEPATCKFSLQDQNYEVMENDALCDNEINQVTLNRWLCLAQLNVSQISNTGSYSFRCADKPWLGTGEEGGSSLDPERNVNVEGINYSIQKTTTALKINSITLNGTTIYVASEPVSVTLEISTSGGIDNGKAFCIYTLDNRWTADFSQTDSTTHKQTWTSLNAGSHTVDVQCTDRAVGNVVNENAQFNIEIDNISPLITRVYNSGNSLRVVTNEPSTCAYSIDSCSFDFAKGTLLSGLDHYHTMPYNNGITYRIKCKDSFENIGTCLSVTGGY